MSKETNCPRCGGPISGYPALSRRDNKTDICSDCGSEEAMFDFGLRTLPEPLIREFSFMQKLINEKDEVSA